MIAIILAAGVGSRLGRPYPKTLCTISQRESILSRQVRLLKKNHIQKIIVVVGFKMNLIMEHCPQVLYKYNPLYYITNTSKSLLVALEGLDEDIIWMNGDVVFSEEILKAILEDNNNLICVNSSPCGEEEVKYSLDQSGKILNLSKKVFPGEGEALGINRIQKEELPSFRGALSRCDNQAYFEEGVEMMIQEGIPFYPKHVSKAPCMEVDFEEDLDKTIQIFKSHP